MDRKSYRQLSFLKADVLRVVTDSLIRSSTKSFIGIYIDLLLGYKKV